MQLRTRGDSLAKGERPILTKYGPAQGAKWACFAPLTPEQSHRDTVEYFNF